MERAGTESTNDLDLKRLTRSVNEIECIERLREKFRAAKEPRQIFDLAGGD